MKVSPQDLAIFWIIFFQMKNLRVEKSFKVNKTKGLQLCTVSKIKINSLINPVNTRGTCSDKTSYSNI